MKLGISVYHSPKDGSTIKPPPQHQTFYLRSYPFTDHQLLVDMFSLEEGRIRGILRLGKKDFNQSALVPFNRLVVRLTGKEQSEMKRMNILRIERQLFDVSSQYISLCLLQHWANMVVQSQPSGQVDARVFRLIDHVTAYFLSNPDPAHFLYANLYFEWWLLVLCGEFPVVRSEDELKCLPEGGFFLKKGNKVISTKSICSESDKRILLDCFKQTIEVFVSNAIQYGRLDCLFEASGLLWDELLDKKIHTRTTLTDCLREKGFL